jgi:arginyl-tRNA synthetase
VIEASITREIRRILGKVQVSFNVPPRKEIGDLSTAVALAHAAKLGRQPMELAEELAETLQAQGIPYLREVSATPPGYINFRIDLPSYVRDTVRQVLSRGERYGLSRKPRKKRILIEHTSVNPNKAMHIGHLRNAIIGDAVARILRFVGHDVQVISYVDDTGVQVADVVVGMLYLHEPRYTDGMDNLSPFWSKYRGDQPFDHYCWDLYAEVQEAYRTEPELLERRNVVLRLLEAGDNPIARFGRELATRIMAAHVATTRRLSVSYDLLCWESDVLHRGFWATAFERLKASGGVVFEEYGPNAGCWVVRYGRGVVSSEESVHSEDQVLVRSNGTVTYTGKDLSFQMWKFGLLPADFLYAAWGYETDTKRLWTTVPDGTPMPGFGHADRVVNVIDVRQSYPQEIIAQSLRYLGYTREARNSKHLAYEIVALSPQAADELGVPSTGMPSDSAVAMSGRLGIGVKVDDLLARMMNRLSAKIEEPQAANALASAAMRYFMLRMGINKLMAFDFDEALRAVGDTGVYLEYAHARASSILARAAEAHLDDLSEMETAPAPARVTLAEETLARKIGEFPAVMTEAAKELSPTVLARYCSGLASAFNEFYEHPDPEAGPRTPFIKIADPALRVYRLALVAAFRQTLENGLSVLGIKPLSRI